MDELNDELLINILEFTSSSLEYMNICKSIGREVYIPHVLKVHSRVDVDEKGNIRTYLDGKLHSFNDEPAVVFSSGYKAWYKGGKRHRDNDEPAIIYSNGTKFWYKNGLKHRDGVNPAEIYSTGTRIWYKNGNLLYSRF